ncbi:MAG TPA: cupin domain-containing protein, partial [Streptosporangiaceae bacterium]|nr:cupin domain-containing protein [Streptosporangiaceae bacterium]
QRRGDQPDRIGRRRPSAATLRKLAASLEIPVFRLFLPVESEAVKVVRHTDRITIGRPRSGARYQLLSPSVQGQLEVMEVSTDPGQDSARELLSHAGEECLVVITGRGALELSDAVIDLRAAMSRPSRAAFRIGSVTSAAAG